VRIVEELRGRGVSKELSRQAVDGLGVDWLVAARAARAKRFGDQLPGGAADRGAQMRFLQYRGFPADIVRRCLTSHDDPATDIFEV
jgi:regulatory protein